MRYDISSSRKIMGTPFFIACLPLLAAGYLSNRNKEPKMSPDGVRQDAVDTWESIDYCLSCHKDTLHTFILFREEPVVESECSYCLAIREREDRG